jgi:D-galacturonate reductase
LIISQRKMDAARDQVNVLMVGSGEYTTGFVNGAKSDSDKGAGVVALTMFDLRRRQKVKDINLCGKPSSHIRV